MDIDFTRLRYFVAVAEELHFKRAADRLMITPPPLSKQIMRLEREVGGPLFVRNYHSVRLTPLGEHLLERARVIVRQGAEFRAAARAFAAAAAPLRIGVTAYAPSDFLERFETAVTGLPVATAYEVPGSTADVAAKLVAGTLDLGLIQLQSAQRRLCRRVVAEYQGGIAVRADDPLAARTAISIDELRDRQVAVDLARPNPTALAELTRSLHRVGVDQVVRAATGQGGELEIAHQVFQRRLVALVVYAPNSFIGRLFAPPEFALIPVDTARWRPMPVAVAWTAEGARRHPALERIVDDLAGTLRGDPR